MKKGKEGDNNERKKEKSNLMKLKWFI